MSNEITLQASPFRPGTKAEVRSLKSERIPKSENRSAPGSILCSGGSRQSFRISGLSPAFLILALLLFSPRPSPGAPALWLGTNQVPAGTVAYFSAPPNARARMEAARLSHRVDFIKGAIAIPPRFHLRTPWPILIVSVPSGGSSTKAVQGYTNIAFRQGWVVLAGDGPSVTVEEDTVQWGWAMLSSVLDHVTRSWPPTKPWPVACAGFSGGAKRSGTVAAAMMKEGYHVIGIFMGGCNEDRASLGWQLYQPGERFKQMPIFLSNGASDPIAGPQPAAAVANSMRQNGFTKLRVETYGGGHRLNDEHLRLALEWFQSPASR